LFFAVTLTLTITRAKGEDEKDETKHTTTAVHRALAVRPSSSPPPIRSR
jgi:hypothetical protein